MAFNKDKIAPITNNSRSGDMPMVWGYYNSAGDTMTTAGFIETGFGIRAVDTVMVWDADGDIVWYKAAVNATTKVITLTAIA